MFKKLLMMIMILLIGVACAGPTIALAQNVLDACTTGWSWTNSTSTDTVEHRLYVTKDGTANPPVSIPMPTNTISCAASGTTGTGVYIGHVTAVDDGGLESAPSNLVNSTVVPTAPSGTCINGTFNGAPIQFCN